MLRISLNWPLVLKSGYVCVMKYSIDIMFNGQSLCLLRFGVFCVFWVLLGIFLYMSQVVRRLQGSLS